MTRANFRANKVIKNERTVFFTGGNSSCWVHIRQHYDIYKERCKAGNIPENHHAIPQHLYQQNESRQEGQKGLSSQRLMASLTNQHTWRYTRVMMRCMRLHSLLHAMTRCVRCWCRKCYALKLTSFDQALAITEKPIFRNCLVAMRLKTTRKDLPSRHDIEVHIHNEFVDWLKTLKGEILVSKSKSEDCLNSPPYTGSPWLGLFDGRWVDSR